MATSKTTETGLPVDEFLFAVPDEAKRNDRNASAMIKLLWTILLITVLHSSAKAQTTHADSMARMAVADARKFKLDAERMKIFRQQKDHYLSDLFKPTEAQVSRPDVLNDSNYVYAFRAEAYRRTLKRRTTGHWILVGSGISVAATYLATAVVLAVLFHKESK